MSDAGIPADGASDQVRPIVRTASSSNLGLWLFGVAIVLGGFLLFYGLNARREAMNAPVIQPGTAGGVIAAPPPLAVPSRFSDPYFDQDARLVRAIPLAPSSPILIPRAPAMPRNYQPRPAQLSPDELATIHPQQQPYLPPPPPLGQLPLPPAPGPAAAVGERVSASRLADPSLTVPKGTIIAAVLETALDSTRPGAVRAIVSRDVKGFDGSHVLIPRGSRLYGEYQADVGSGQNRALIHWLRLTRPDAVIINLDSTAADPLGRAGVEGKVNSHFFARFGSAILQSVLDIGVGLATRSVNDNALIIGLPGSTQQVAGQLQQSTQVQPTLRVQQGTSVSVFVAHDLDFSTVDR